MSLWQVLALSSTSATLCHMAKIAISFIHFVIPCHMVWLKISGLLNAAKEIFHINFCVEKKFEIMMKLWMTRSIWSGIKIPKHAKINDYVPHTMSCCEFIQILHGKSTSIRKYRLYRMYVFVLPKFSYLLIFFLYYIENHR